MNIFLVLMVLLNATVMSMSTVRRGFSPYSMLMKNKYFKRSPTIDQAVAPVVPPADYWPVEGDQYEQSEY
jgi:hypothetical protein